MAKLADPLPHICSVCLQPPMVRDHTLRYVDFEAAYEGPVVTRYGERVESGQTVQVSIDDIMICEECLRAGARLIGMENADQVREQISDLNAENQRLQHQVVAKDRMIADLDHSVGVAIDYPINRPARAPKVTGPEEKKAELTKLRSNRRTAAKISKTMKEKQ